MGPTKKLFPSLNLKKQIKRKKFQKREEDLENRKRAKPRTFPKIMESKL